MMREPAIGSYRDADGARHELVVRQTADGGWHVLDIDVNGETAHVVDALAGDQDGRPQAEAIARDYLTTVGAHEPSGRDRRPASPYLSKEDPMPAATAAPARHRANSAREGLRCRVRLADGRVFTGPLAPERHRALQLGDPARARPAGSSRSPRAPAATAACRSRPAAAPTTSCPADRPAEVTGWGHCWRSPRGTPTPARRCSSPRPFGQQRAGDKHAVSETRFLWVDVDRPDGLPALWAFLAERPCHLLVESSAGHAHAYWKLDRPLPATSRDRVDR